MNKHTTAPIFKHRVYLVLPFKHYDTFELVNLKLITIFLYNKSELKHVTMVTDLRCFETPGPGADAQTNKQIRYFSGQDDAFEERESGSTSHVTYTGRMKKRLCLVLDCLVPHDFSSKNAELINLQHYVIREKKLTEKHAILIFFDIVRIVESLHSVSVKAEKTKKSVSDLLFSLRVGR